MRLKYPDTSLDVRNTRDLSPVPRAYATSVDSSVIDRAAASNFRCPADLSDDAR
jgi:hypothetical protein